MSTVTAAARVSRQSASPQLKVVVVDVYSSTLVDCVPARIGA